MNLNREENYKYRKLCLTVLSKTLDDICPKFDGETEKTKSQLIKERIKTFKNNERELDKEWQELEEEAELELRQFHANREKILKKIERTRKTEKIEAKVKELNHKKHIRVSYLIQKQKDMNEIFSSQLKELEKDSRAYKQLKRKISTYNNSIQDKIRKTEFRYNTIINNTLNSDNSEKVKERIEQSIRVWDRKFDKLKAKFIEREIIYENKRFELDQIRMAIEDFEEQLPRMMHWCLMAGVSLKDCYTSVVERMRMVERESEKINTILERIKLEGDIELL